ncbi:MAG: ribosomal protein S18-alanine N-acetyltransferase [Candidatus Methylomirabilales bacterium]|jgi:ribosomal-protein-alanine N-acetyltransferase
MRPEDLDGVLRIEATSFTEPWTREMFQAEMIPGVSLALVVRSEEDEVLGYLFGSVAGGEFHISNIAVDPRVRRQRVGRNLLLVALDEASRRGAQTASLEVRASNLAAQALYTHVGFTVVGRRRRYYTGPVEDAVIMYLPHVGTAVGTQQEGERS